MGWGAAVLDGPGCFSPIKGLGSWGVRLAVLMGLSCTFTCQALLSPLKTPALGKQRLDVHRARSVCGCTGSGFAALAFVCCGTGLINLFNC